MKFVTGDPVQLNNGDILEFGRLEDITLPFSLRCEPSYHV